MIPEFNIGGVLPPFLGQQPGRAHAEQSPYQASVFEVVERFATNPERIALLRGLLDYRAALRGIGIAQGYQWLDGSFVEDKERIRGAPPGDIDIVSLIHRPADVADDTTWGAFVAGNHALFDPGQVKATFGCEAFFIDLYVHPEHVAGQSAYWFGLFSHQRDTFRWKGIVQIRLEEDDGPARAELERRASAWQTS